MKNQAVKKFIIFIVIVLILAILVKVAYYQGVNGQKLPFLSEKASFNINTPQASEKAPIDQNEALLGGETSTFRQWKTSNGYLEPAQTYGQDMLLSTQYSTSTRYLNFGLGSGASYPGFRMFNGTMQWMNLSGSWQDIGSGGGSGGSSVFATGTPGVYYLTEYLTRRTVFGGNATTTNDYLQATNGFYANTARIGSSTGLAYLTSGTVGTTSTIGYASLTGVPAFLTTESDPIWVSASSSYALITGSVASSTQAGHLVVDGTNCSSGNYPLGIDTYGNVQSCTAALTLSSFSASAPLSYNNGTGAFSISEVSTSTNGYLSSANYNYILANLGGSGGGTWGSITGTLANQTDLVSALNLRSFATTTITAGSGLSGGGDLSTNRTLTLNMAGGTCTGTDKISAITATGTITCSADQTGGGTGTPQDLYATSSPTFAGLTLTGFSGYLKAATGVFGTTSSIPWSDISSAPSFFSATSSIDHNTLANLDVGSSYLHLTTLQKATSTTQANGSNNGWLLKDDWTTFNNKLSTTTWGGIGGTLSNQLDLQSALNAKIGLSSLSAVAPLSYNNGTGAFSLATSSLNHANLFNLQGGTTNEYYHLTSAQATVVGNTSGTNTGNETTTTIGALVDGSSATTSLGVGFKIPVWDNIASLFRHITWANILALLDARFQPLEATLTDIADGTIAENLVNTANPWADNEVADDITAGNVEGTDYGTLTNGYYCTYDSVGTEIDCASQYTIASALSADPTDCSANQFANAIGTNGNLTCSALADADIPNTITINLSASSTQAGYLSTNGTNCSSGNYPLGVDQYGNVESCTAVSISTTTMGTLINSASATTTPGDNDLVAMSNATNLIKLTWANLKTALLAFFQPLSAKLTALANNGFDWGISGTRELVSPATITNATSTGDTVTMNVNSNDYGFGALMYVNSGGTLNLSDGLTTTTIPALFMATETGTGNKRMLIKGVIRNDAWNFTTKGAPLYVSTSTLGMPTTTMPVATGQTVQIVGWSIATNTMMFSPQLTWIGL